MSNRTKRDINRIKKMNKIPHWFNGTKLDWTVLRYVLIGRLEKNALEKNR